MNQFRNFYTESASLILSSKSRPVADLLVSEGYEVSLPEAINKKIPGRKESVLVGFLKHGQIMPYFYPRNMSDNEQEEAYKDLRELIQEHHLKEFSNNTIFI